MPQDLSFTQINNLLTEPIFSIVEGDLMLNVSTLTSDTYASLNNTGVIELCFKLLKACYETQIEVNKTATDATRLSSFSNPFYGTVNNGNPPTIEGSITVTGLIPLNIDDLNAR